ncbi:hypothetical protein AKI39_22215 [Bordetella sp. H567]|nr:hypothetical protein AKI39_22215 [Bordetella sp. H567]
MDAFVQWVAGLPPAVFLRNSSIGYLLVNAAHIAALGILVGSITALDLRLLWSRGTVPLREFGPYLSNLAAVALGFAVITGLLLFSVKADEYVRNWAFLVKVVVVGLGIVNAVWLHAGPHWRRALREPQIPRALRMHAAASLLFWLSAIVAGRWIGFL